MGMKRKAGGRTVLVPRLTKPSGRGSIGGLYAAKLLFEFRVIVDGVPGARRLCEERLILLQAPRAREALHEAKRQARRSQHRYRNSDNSPVLFQFVGVMDLLHLGVECEPNEVWYSIGERMRPMERRQEILPKESELQALREEAMFLGHRSSSPSRK